MKKLYRPVGLALVMMLGLILLSCNREGSDGKKSMMLLDQDPLSAKDNPAIVTRESPAFATNAEHPPLFEPAPWLKPGDTRPNAMESDSSPAGPEKADFSKGVPIPEEPKPGGPVKF
jgi:hypothetical protein